MPTGASWRVRRLGTPREALALETRPSRTPGPGEVRVRVEAVGLNHPDLLLCAGKYQERPPLPFSPGYEAAGTIVETGSGSIRQAGERVIVVPELPEGALQESLTVPDEQVYPVPDTMPATTAAVLHIAYSTAHAALHRRARIRPGETLLVTGGAGGVGSAAIQLAKAAGVYVVATATGPDKADACRAFGADEVIDLTSQQDPTRKADVILDVVGGELFDRARRWIAFEGRIVTVGFTSGTIPVAPVNHVLLKNYSIDGLHLAAYRRHNPQLLRDIHDDLVTLHAAGNIKPVTRELPFDQAPDALDLLARREVIGRVVLVT